MRLPLEDVIKEVCQVDFPDKFPDFVDRCMRYIHSGDAQSIFGAVVSLEQLAFIFSFRGRDRRGALDEVVKMTFPTLRDLLAQVCLLVEQTGKGVGVTGGLLVCFCWFFGFI